MNKKDENENEENLDKLCSTDDKDSLGSILKYVSIDGKSEKGSKYADY